MEQELINKMAEAIEKATDCIIDEYYCFNNEKTIAKAALAVIQEDYVLVEKQKYNQLLQKIRKLENDRGFKDLIFGDANLTKIVFNAIVKLKELGLIKFVSFNYLYDPESCEQSATISFDIRNKTHLERWLKFEEEFGKQIYSQSNGILNLDIL